MPGGKAAGGSEQPGLTYRQMEAAIKWPSPGEDQAWERETSTLHRPGGEISSVACDWNVLQRTLASRWHQNAVNLQGGSACQTLGLLLEEWTVSWAEIDVLMR